MVNLAVLLIGPDAMRRRWAVLAALGIAWALFGLAIMADASDGVTVVTTQSFGYLMVIEGLAAVIAMAVAIFAGGKLLLLRALVLIALGLLIIDMPWHNDIANSILFGLAFLIDGAIRIIAAFLLRHPRWKITVLGGVVELALAALAFSNWPLSYQKTVPFCIGVALLLTGAAVARLGFVMRRLTPGSSIFELPLFSPRGWHVRVPVPDAPVAPPEARARETLFVRVWTPAGSAEDPARRPLVDRYLAAVDRKGAISTGHAALELPPDVYISHYPGQEIERSPDEFARILRATAENDVPGRFQPSYAIEAADWCEADGNVAFHRFDAGRLRAFWDIYRRDATYNLTNRNCSIVVAVGLEVALEGVLATKRGYFKLFSLVTNPDFWFAAMIRARAEAMTWTPGLVLDYATALHRIVEPAELSWFTRLAEGIRRYRASRSANAQTSPA